MEQYDVFICYRRDGGEMLAHILYERLTEAGYSVFQDIESLRSGNFNEALYDVIDNCKDVIVVLPPNGLERCNNEDDWVRRELKRAIEKEKNIVPVTLRGFKWPKKLPEDIDALRNKNALSANPEYFDRFIEKLFKFLNSKQKKKVKEKKSKYLAFYIIMTLVSISIVISPLILIYIFNQPFLLYQRIIYAILLIIIARSLVNKIQSNPKYAAACYGTTITEEGLTYTVDQLYSKVVSTFGKKIFISKDVPKGFTDYRKLKRLEFGSWEEDKKVNYLKILFRRKIERYDPSLLFLNSLTSENQAVKMLTKQGFIIQDKPDFISDSADLLVKDDVNILLYYRHRLLNKAVVYICDTEQLKDRFLEDE